MSISVFHEGQWKKLTKSAYNSMPVGTSFMFRGTQAPYGCLVEDGSLLQIATYPQLYKAIGTLYGGDGVSTFALPNSIGRYNRGELSGIGGTEEAGLPNIEGETGSLFSSTAIGSGALNNGEATSSTGITSTTSGPAKTHNVMLDASRSSPIYGNSDTVTPATIIGLPCIKAFDTIADGVEVKAEHLAQDIQRVEAKVDALPELTEEHVVGYLNGKPVYEVYVSAISTNSTTTVTIADVAYLNIYELLQIDGSIRTSGDDTAYIKVPINWERTTGSGDEEYISTWYYPYDKAIRNQVKGKSVANCPMKIRLQYTKTTD